MTKRILIITILSLFTFASTASAFIITSQLTGDPRTAHPAGLIVDVTINVSTDYFASWTVDINSPLHTGIKLDAFYFNLDVTTAQAAGIIFDGFDPTGWAVSTPADNAPASGGANFIFEADKSGGNEADVTNAMSLTFNMTTLFALTEDTFLGAPYAISNNSVLGSGQLGAHLQSLTQVQGDGTITNSGFAFGDYEGGGIPPQSVVPEPSTFILLGAGLIGLAVYRRKKH
jgi:hypothetical protein